MIHYINKIVSFYCKCQKISLNICEITKVEFFFFVKRWVDNHSQLFTCVNLVFVFISKNDSLLFKRWKELLAAPRECVFIQHCIVWVMNTPAF